MRTLSRRALVDIGFDQWGHSQRIIMTQAGKRLLANARSTLIEAGREIEVGERAAR
jgi:hypothetical protein